MTEPPRRPPPPAPGTRIIRRAPTGAVPVIADHSGVGRRVDGGAAVPIAACVVAILSGWATTVVATDLIASWWRTDRLFCVAVGFLTAVFAATTVGGVILLLRRGALGRYLIAIGAVVALLTFASLFIAGARVPRIVYAVPAIQITTAVLALHPATKRWLPS